MRARVLSIFCKVCRANDTKTHCRGQYHFRKYIMNIHMYVCKCMCAVIITTNYVMHHLINCDKK